MLYLESRPPSESDKANPTLVFLHGLLGDTSDWNEVSGLLEDFPRLFIDLPRHGRSQNVAPDSFLTTCRLVAETIENSVEEGTEIVLSGYSLGARLVMFGITREVFSRLNIIGCFIEGGNTGLTSESDRKLRLENDNRWARRFESEPIEQVLNDWYRQPVFSSLNSEQRQALIKNRAHNLGSGIADMLRTTSLAKQPDLSSAIMQCDIPVHYICGVKDSKFLNLARESRLSFTSIEDAGHNVHKEQAVEYARLIRRQTKKFRLKV